MNKDAHHFLEAYKNEKSMCHYENTYLNYRANQEIERLWWNERKYISELRKMYCERAKAKNCKFSHLENW